MKLLSFQSPYGDFGTLTFFAENQQEVFKEVSVPLRGFWYADAAAPQTRPQWGRRSFSPLTGILVR